MPRVIYLDSGPLGLICHPRPKEGSENEAVQRWLGGMLEGRARIIIPAIADFEVRRELIRGGSWDAVALLDEIESGQHPEFPRMIYLPLADNALRRAAGLWAEARNKGYATAGGQALDGDVLVAAQALEHAGQASRFTIATGNVKDLARYVGNRRARPWGNIVP